MIPVLLSALLTSAGAWSCNDVGATETLQKKGLADIDTKAVCNDGSEAAYYIKDNGNPHLWVIYLSGGGWCYDKESCAARFNGTEYPHHDCSNSSEAAPCYGSSKDYPQTCGKTGILDVDATKTPLHSANKVYVPYCSSDGYMGDGEFAGWQFRGARIVRAVLSALKRQGDVARGSTVVFGGGSAGGRGAMVLLDEVAAMLPGVTVRGFLDSPYYVDVQSYSQKFSGFQIQHVGVLENFNATSVLSAECSAAHKTEPWKCLFGQYRMPFVATPYLMAAAQFDGWQLSHLVHAYSGIEASPVFTANETIYVQDFGAKIHAFVQTLPAASAPWAIIYSTACYNHHISEKTNFWSVTTSSGISESMAVQQLLSGKAGQIIDTCSGYNCGRGCSSSRQFLTV